MSLKPLEVNVDEAIAIIKKVDTSNLHNNDWLRTWDLSDDEIRATFELACSLEHLWINNVDCSCLKGSLAVSEFRDNSTRTRFSFSQAVAMLGMSIQELEASKSQKAHGETNIETANMISFQTEVIGIRDDKFIGEGHEYQVEMAEAVAQGYREGVLPQRPCIINLQCDQDHPTQSMCDLVHMSHMAGGIENLKGKKIAMTWAYSPAYGKPLSVPQGIITLMTRFGMHVDLAFPEGYDLLPETIEVAKKHAAASGGKFTIGHDMSEAIRDADFVYSKSWCPFEIMKQRTELLRAGKGDSEEMVKLECDALNNNKKFMDWELTEERMALAKADAHVMHCLPADITGENCEHGEVASSVFNRFRAEQWKEAQHKAFVQAAMIMCCRFKNPGTVLEKIVQRNAKRRLEDLE